MRLLIGRLQVRVPPGEHAPHGWSTGTERTYRSVVRRPAPTARLVRMRGVCRHGLSSRAEPGHDCRHPAGVVGLPPADRRQRVGALREHVRHHVFQLACLVAAVGEAGVAVLAPRPDPRAPRCAPSRSSGWIGLGLDVNGYRGSRRSASPRCSRPGSGLGTGCREDGGESGVGLRAVGVVGSPGRRDV